MCFSTKQSTDKADSPTAGASENIGAQNVSEFTIFGMHAQAFIERAPYYSRNRKASRSWAFIPCRGDDLGLAKLLPSRYSRAYWMWI